MLDESGPEEVSKQVEACLAKNDINGLRDLYEKDAVFADYDGAARGWPDIQAAHQGFLDAGLNLTLHDSVVFEAGGIALVHWSWTVRQEDGSTTDGRSAEVLRRQADGSWKFVIDNSDGSGLIGVL